MDTSVSMAGDKIKMMKSSLWNFIKTCTERDRISLISFNYSAERIIPLIKCSATGKEILKEKLKTLKHVGGTNIHPGMQVAMKTILRRKTKNKSTSIFLLSDGPDSCALKSTIKMFEKGGLGKGKASLANFTLNTFGYSENHDAALLKKLADYKNGRFYMVENIQNLKQCLVKAYEQSYKLVSGETRIDVKTNLPIKKDSDQNLTYTEEGFILLFWANICFAK
jgi:Mg-chelatase subunit ChlD